MSNQIKKPSRQEQDPTGQHNNRKRASRDNDARLNNANRKVLALWRNIKSTRVTQKVITNDSAEFYTYDLSPFDEAQLHAEIDAIINGGMETELLIAPWDWYYEDYIETATRGGVIQESSWIDVLLLGVITSLISTVSIFASTRYKEMIAVIVTDNYRLLKGLSSKTSGQVYDVIKRGMDAGLGKAAIQREITKRFQVSKSGAKRIVNTEINRAYNNARMHTTKAHISAGALLAVQHISALLPTTRNHHAVRHGKAYTPEQQMIWWETGTNRIQCHCSIRTIAINKDGTIKNKAAQDKLIERGKLWFKSG